jgi:hypothetical protein
MMASLKKAELMSVLYKYGAHACGRMGKKKKMSKRACLTLIKQASNKPAILLAVAMLKAAENKSNHG